MTLAYVRAEIIDFNNICSWHFTHIAGIKIHFHHIRCASKFFVAGLFATGFFKWPIKKKKRRREEKIAQYKQLYTAMFIFAQECHENRYGEA